TRRPPGTTPLGGSLCSAVPKVERPGAGGAPMHARGARRKAREGDAREGRVAPAANRRRSQDGPNAASGGAALVRSRVRRMGVLRERVSGVARVDAPEPPPRPPCRGANGLSGAQAEGRPRESTRASGHFLRGTASGAPCLSRHRVRRRGDRAGRRVMRTPAAPIRPTRSRRLSALHPALHPAVHPSGARRVRCLRRVAEPAARLPFRDPP
ncbi:MAG: hypothetical protein RI967_2471, partial [Planctomycetota bacterium]